MSIKTTPPLTLVDRVALVAMLKAYADSPADQPEIVTMMVVATTRLLKAYDTLAAENEQLKAELTASRLKES